MQDLQNLLGYGRAFAEAWQNMLKIEDVRLLSVYLFKDVYDYIYDRRCLDASKKLVNPQNLLSKAFG